MWYLGTPGGCYISKWSRCIKEKGMVFSREREVFVGSENYPFYGDSKKQIAKLPVFLSKNV
jgi:hypothetical protein